MLGDPSEPLSILEDLFGDGAHDFSPVATSINERRLLYLFT
jgi:hypothetical protein